MFREVQCQRKVSRAKVRDSYDLSAQDGTGLQDPSKASKLETEVLQA